MVSTYCGPDMTVYSSVIALAITVLTALVRLIIRASVSDRKLKIRPVSVKARTHCHEAAQMSVDGKSSAKECQQGEQFLCGVRMEDSTGITEQARESGAAPDAATTRSGRHRLVDATLVINSIEDVRKVCDYGIQDVFRELCDEDGPFPVFAYVTEKDLTCTSEVEFYDNEGFLMGVVEGGMMSPPEIHEWSYVKCGAEEADLESAAYVAARHLGCMRLPCGRPKFWIPA